MPIDPTHPHRLKLDQALDLVMSQRGQVVIPITAGDSSMIPHLRGGDAVLAIPPDGVPSSGELVLFWQMDYWVVHRSLGPVVTRDGRSGLRTRGDGRNALDPLVVVDDVRARIVAVRRGGVWRSLDGTPARIYARLVAWHDLFWAAAGVVAGRVGLGRAVAATDRALLRLAVPLVFPLIHGRIAAPAGSVAGEPV
jgi:hypothetical protein